MNKTSDVKVLFEVDPMAWHGHASEALWAADKKNGLYRLENVPFFAKDVSYGDVVAGSEDSDGNIRFRGVITRSGHSTVRVVGPSEQTAQSPFCTSLEELLKLGCRYESGTIQDLAVFAVDVPPSSDIGEVYRALEQGREAELWDWELGFDGHPPDRDE